MDFSGLEALALAAANASTTPDDAEPDAVSLPSFSRLLAKLPPPPPHEPSSLTQHVSQPSPETLSGANRHLHPNVTTKAEVGTAALSAIPMHLHVYTDSQATQIDPKTNMQFTKLVDSPVSILAPDSRIADVQKDSGVGTSALVSPTSSTGASPPAHTGNHSFSDRTASHDESSHGYHSSESIISHASVSSTLPSAAFNMQINPHQTPLTQIPPNQDSIQNMQMFAHHSGRSIPWNVAPSYPQYQTYPQPYCYPPPAHEVRLSSPNFHDQQLHHIPPLHQHQQQQLQTHKLKPSQQQQQQQQQQEPHLKQSTTTAATSASTSAKASSSSKSAARVPPAVSTTTRGTARKRETSRRYRLNKSQVACLTHLFNLDPNPSSVTHGRVANVTGMPRKAVRLWFQNARAKLRREARTTGFQDPATPYELRKYQLFQQQQHQQQQQQQQLAGSESPTVEAIPVVANGGYRSYEVPDMVLRGMTEIAEDVNTALEDYVRGAFGTVARVAGRASSSSRTARQLDDDEAGDDDSDETEVDDDEVLSGDDVPRAAK
ncbi:hypothetical protein BJ741DRAFT_621397 [Chytriomyces cf. hyalinus JEL632]|nr:hypothetical protein BJ741DRAFT_621397 [Chytriomyces cf. hyalinus JEL632]